ncbi:MAG: hypothetical protein ACR2KW_06040 [Rubrobacter sp.]
MALNTLSEKDSGAGGKCSNKKSRTISGKKVKSAADGNRDLVLALAVFTALVVVAIVAFAVVSTPSGGESPENFTPNGQGLIGEGRVAPDFGGENRVVWAHSGETPREVFEGWIEEALG